MAGRREPTVGYDSRVDTLIHARKVAELAAQVAARIVHRAILHDASKLEDPELAIFDVFTPKLRASTYGSEDYKTFLAEMGEGLAHHYAENRHHPEHFAEGIAGMNLIDLVEMLCDWTAATLRHDDGSIRRSLVLQAERFGIEDQLAQILTNTVRDMFWMDREVGEDT